MTHQLDHSTTDGSACIGYVDGRDSLTAHRAFVTCRICRAWLKVPENSEQARDLELRVMGKQ